MPTKKKKQLKITLVKSPIGTPKDQQATLESLGLHKLHHSVIQPDNPAIRGMIFKLQHLVAFEEVSG
ncbi:MAG: 50S ribosomal protein L30 [Firmicutes bacterium]|nr:50S ribosomal protein L30 [Bacillota bacterium]